MRVVLQRVTSASVRVDGDVVGRIGRGLLCLVSVGLDDTEEDAEHCCRRLLNCRLWPDAKDTPWKTSVRSNGYEMLLVSQFTLHGYFSGNKPDFHLAMAPEPAKVLFDNLCDRVRAAHSPEKVAEGVFGAYMEVSLVNDGPITLCIDSKVKKPSKGRDALPVEAEAATLSLEDATSTQPTEQ